MKTILVLLTFAVGSFCCISEDANNVKIGSEITSTNTSIIVQFIVEDNLPIELIFLTVKLKNSIAVSPGEDGKSVVRVTNLKPNTTYFFR